MASMASEPEEIVREVRIAASPEQVFPYFTDADKLVVWKAARAELDARPGGAFRMDVTGRGNALARGEYVVIDPPRRVVFTWEWEDRSPATPPVRSVVEVTLSPDGDGTLLRLVHRGVPQEIRRGSAAGWAHYLARLALAAAGHDPGPDPWATAEPGSPIVEIEIEGNK
jgi:uncharacterized protein YndB with AHSA1/START domain